jgi:ribosomal-protein-alanine N-acetyltransferase
MSQRAEQRVYSRFPIMDLGDVVLRDFRESDVEAFLEYLQHPKVNRYIPEVDIPRTIPEAIKEMEYWSDLYKYQRSIYWAVVRKSSDRLIGTIGFNSWNRTHRRVEISYDLSHAYWGKGIMTRALQAVCGYAFTTMEAYRIQGTVALDNIPSQKVMAKNGFKREGILKGYGILRGVAYDFHMMGLIEKDFTL